MKAVILAAWMLLVNAFPSAPDPAQLYPRLITGAADSAGLVRPLGNGLAVALVADQDGVLKEIKAADLKKMDLTPALAHRRALDNLSAYFRAGKMKIDRLEGPRDAPYIMCSSYWLCSSLLLYSELADWAGEILGSEDLLLSVPHRDALIVFRQGKKTDPAAWKKFIAEKEAGAPDPLTPELFELKDKAVRPLGGK